MSTRHTSLAGDCKSGSLSSLSGPDPAVSVLVDQLVGVANLSPFPVLLRPCCSHFLRKNEPSRKGSGKVATLGPGVVPWCFPEKGEKELETQHLQEDVLIDLCLL